MTAYIDTSVLAAYYCPEAMSDQAQQVLAKEVRPALSVLTEVELVSAVARKVRTGEIGKNHGHHVIALFTAHLDKGYYVRLNVNEHHWRLARDWISHFHAPLRTLDALHLSLAFSEGLELITSDKLLCSSANVLGVPARLLRSSNRGEYSPISRHT